MNQQNANNFEAAWHEFCQRQAPQGRDRKGRPFRNLASYADDKHARIERRYENSRAFDVREVQDYDSRTYDGTDDRADRVWVRAFNTDGSEVEIELVGMASALRNYFVRGGSTNANETMTNQLRATAERLASERDDARRERDSWSSTARERQNIINRTLSERDEARRLHSETLDTMERALTLLESVKLPDGDAAALVIHAVTVLRGGE